RLGGGADDQPPGPLGRQAGERGRVTAREPVAARGAAQRLDRHARLRERFGVALNRPLGDLEMARELSSRELPTRLQEQEQRDQSARAHRAQIYTTKGDGITL